ncbi:MAG: AAA family ATPase [Pseudomonadota bacterium]
MTDRPGCLYIMAGLPGVGKSALSKRLSRGSGAIHLRIDTIEQALRDLTGIDVEGEGYRLAYRIAADNLTLGQSVVADSCNPITLTRDEWQAVAENLGARYRHIEVVCSDKGEHRRRVEHRESEVAGLDLPNWQDVLNREYHAWDRDRLVIDTAGQTVDDSAANLLRLCNLD